MRLPDLIIGGAPRSGTAWPSALLESHPETEMARPGVPEPKLFHHDGLYARGLE